MNGVVKVCGIISFMPLNLLQNFTKRNLELFLIFTFKYTNMSLKIKHYLLLFVAKSYGAPVKLACEDHDTKKIDVSGISLFKSKRAVEANHVYPGIQAQSQSECQQTFHPVIMNKPAECQLSFLGRKIPSDVMTVTVYRCLTRSDLQRKRKFVHMSK